MHSVHALHILRAYGMESSLLQIVFKAVIVAKLSYTASLWWEFMIADDWQWLQAVIPAASDQDCVIITTEL